MQPRPPFNRALLIPIVIGVISIFGLGWILLTSDLGQILIPPTAIPASVHSLAVRTLTPFPWTTPVQDEATPTATETSATPSPEPPTETLPPTNTSTETLPPPSATPTPERIEPLTAGNYDDTDPNIAYDRYWTVLKDSGNEERLQRCHPYHSRRGE